MVSVPTKYGPLPSVSIPYLDIMEKYAKSFKIPVPIIAGTIKTESSGNAQAWNPSLGENSRGLMQISEKTAQSYPLQISELERLFEPDFNIFNGAKYLGFIRDSLFSSFDQTANEEVKWMVTASSYNQGLGYYKTALQTLTELGIPQDWDNIKYYVLNPTKRSSTPWEANVNNYADSVMSDIDTSYLVTGGISLFAVALAGGAAFYIFSNKKRIKAIL